MWAVPVVVFGYNRPHKLGQVLAALRKQHVSRLVLSIDGPKTGDDLSAVAACRRLAAQIDWTETELDFAERNQGVASLKEKIHAILSRYPAAIFLEDDCVPSPGFYQMMSNALEHYRAETGIFSLGGYQHLPDKFFRNYSFSWVSGARFVGWGWATWQDRWLRAWPLVENYQHLFDDLRNVPEIAGRDLGPAARRMAAGEGIDNWDVRVALAALALKQSHLISVPGLVRTIGQDISGMHGSLSNYLRARLLHNRNIANQAPLKVAWLQDVSVNCNYAAGVRDFAARSQMLSLGGMLHRSLKRIRRSARLQPQRYLNLDLVNVGGEKRAKRALLSYIVHPFSIPEDDPRFYRHVNIWHAREMVHCLNEMGYTVDVIDYRDTAFDPQGRYELFIGHGGVNFASIASRLGVETQKIYFSTGAYWQYHNLQEQQRFVDLQRRRGVSLHPDRMIDYPEEEALEIADAIIGIGNDFTRATYQGWQPVWMIPGTARFDDTFDWCPVDSRNGRNHFLFFASGGNVHKGLDLVLEAFDGLEQHLWVITPLEHAFQRAFRQELFHLPNIHTLGYVLPRSSLYYQTLRRCAWCILPSCSEGQAQSVLEAMNAGIIPLVSREAGVDVSGFGEWIEPVSVDTIRQMVVRAAESDIGDVILRSHRAQQAARTIYAPEVFRPNFRAALEKALANGRAGESMR